MGKIKRGILGGFSGKVANVVGSSWKGISVMKSLPLSVANPKTASQVAQRTKFKAVVAFAVAILSGVIKPLWDRFAQLESGFNAFISENVGYFNADGTYDPSDIVISKGKMEATNLNTVVANETSGAVTYNFDSSTGNPLALPSDQSFVVIQSDDTKEILFGGFDGATRDESAGSKFVGGLVEGEIYNIWHCFKRADGTVVSNSTFYQVAAIA
jgi:hypothetical protein